MKVHDPQPARAKRAMRTWARRVGVGLCAAMGIVMLCASDAPSRRFFLVYNASDSMARGWYWIERSPWPARAPTSLPVGALVLVRLPADAAALAAQRGYLHAGVPLLKRIGAVAPQHVCVHGQSLHVDDRPVATLRARDGAHRPLPAWSACRSMGAGEILLLGDADAVSFDSRYFGPVDASAVIGLAQPASGGLQR